MPIRPLPSTGLRPTGIAVPDMWERRGVTRGFDPAWARQGIGGSDRTARPD